MRATIKIFPYEQGRFKGGQFGDMLTGWKCAHTVETTVHEEGEIKLCEDCAALLDAGAAYEEMERPAKHG
jgi:hypothetical protein